MDRIIVQLPGVKDTARAKNLIGRTALLEFKLVDDEHSLDEALKGNVPEEASSPMNPGWIGLPAGGPRFRFCSKPER